LKKRESSDISVLTEMTEYTTTTVCGDGFTRTSTSRPLRIVIPGGEGHLGQILKGRLTERGHTVTTLTRRPAPGGSRSVLWDGRSLGEWVAEMEGADVLINLAGRSVDCRYNARNRDEILRSRVDSTDVLGKAIEGLDNPPRVWLNSSTATIYRHSLDRAMDEASGELGGNEIDAPASWRFSIEVARRWEEAFFSVRTPRTRKVAMRTAMVMASEPGGIFEAVLRLVWRGLGGSWASGNQFMSWIHEVDFVRTVEFLIEREEIEGVVNLAAPKPLPNREFMSALRSAWGIGFGLPAQEWMLQVGAFLLRTETELLLKSRWVVPGILTLHRFEFLFPAWPEAARDLVQRWRVQRGRGQ
jgi:uncharacterized protein (TIGR01777 family)